jgi:hypothetical protein
LMFFSCTRKSGRSRRSSRSQDTLTAEPSSDHASTSPGTHGDIAGHAPDNGDET